MKAAVTTKYSHIHDETLSLPDGSKLKNEVLNKVFLLLELAFPQRKGLAYSGEGPGKCDQGHDSHCTHVNAVAPCTERQRLRLGSELLHEHTVSLRCFGDFLRGYGGLVAKLVVSLGDETVYLDIDQLPASSAS